MKKEEKREVTLKIWFPINRAFEVILTGLIIGFVIAIF